MTEAEWMECTFAPQVLDYLRDKVSERKCRLFACSCCRLIWGLLDDHDSKRVVEVAERLAEGRVVEHESARTTGSPFRSGYTNAMRAADHTVAIVSEDFPAWVMAAVCSTQAMPERYDDPAIPQIRTAQTTLLRDITGNPYRPIALDPGWRTLTVVALAQAAYDERTLPAGTLDPDRLAVLADALEDAGCDNDDILAHLRSPTPHVRGCWCVDLLLGKE